MEGAFHFRRLARRRHSSGYQALGPQRLQRRSHCSTPPSPVVGACSSSCQCACVHADGRRVLHWTAYQWDRALLAMDDIPIFNHPIPRAPPLEAMTVRNGMGTGGSVGLRGRPSRLDVSRCGACDHVVDVDKSIGDRCAVWHVRVDTTSYTLYRGTLNTSTEHCVNCRLDVDFYGEYLSKIPPSPTTRHLHLL